MKCNSRMSLQGRISGLCLLGNYKQTKYSFFYLDVASKEGNIIRFNKTPCMVKGEVKLNNLDSVRLEGTVRHNWDKSHPVRLVLMVDTLSGQTEQEYL